MRTRFIHAADIHLGYEQYNLFARANDFARAYLAMVDYAIEQEVDFVLLAGDLFHRSNADAWMLTQAAEGLTSLRDAGIPAIAVEGNHDTQHARKNLSWMEFLCDQSLLTLLNVAFGPNRSPVLVPFDSETRRGSWIDIDGTRIYGIKYYGALTARILEEVGEQIEKTEYTVMMMHAGMQGQVPNLHGGLTSHQLQVLRPAVDYLALGHIHKPLPGLDGWIFNPGSLETNSAGEIDWRHGFFDVRVDSDNPVKHQVEAIETPTLRPFVRISVSANGSGDAAEFIEAVEKKIEAATVPAEGAVIELHLGGVAVFKRQEVPTERFRSELESRFSPLIARIRNTIVPPGTVSVGQGDHLSRADVERTIVERLVYQQGSHRDRASAWAQLVLQIKNMAAEKDLPASIVAHIQSTIESMDVAEELPEPFEGDESQAVEATVPVLDLATGERPGDDRPSMAPLFEDW